MSVPLGDDASWAEAPGPGRPRQAKLASLLYAPAEVRERSRRIYEALIDESPQIRAGNFSRLAVDDLERLFRLYDAGFFRGFLSEMLQEDRAYPMAFRLSRRLTRAAGQTIRLVRRIRRGGVVVEQPEYEISVSTTLLFNTFQDVDREVVVGGLACSDRLEALQRIFEHELLHLAEFLGWGRSSCSAENFHALSRRIFAHEGVRHDLVTPREQAASAFGVRVGDAVEFDMEGSRLRGRVNRITRRATVLVEHPSGALFTDGRRYQTFYVPLALLRKL
ncbi:SprT-like family protein [Paludisphaera mucosa]|uniref:SprT-like family protein n=1 Tax=Paludisphaera mucosa TaxID=3030827 RepID=A0ABT6FK64_9BACT|nr:SprT-like family protein [Paludisphaera mucosa]MDG3007904.1 SprT-like family protein [Paludisphaera mucosa]